MTNKKDPMEEIRIKEDLLQGYLDDGMLETAKPIAAELYSYKCETCGELVPETVYAYCRLLICCKYEEEIYDDMIVKAGKMMKKLRESDDGEAFSTMCLYADILSDYYDSPALDEYEEIYSWIIKLEKRKNTDMIRILSLLFDSYNELDLYDEAERTGDELYRIYSSDPELSGSSRIFCLYDSARSAFMNGGYGRALERLSVLYNNEKALLIKEGILADVCYNMSLCYLYNRDFDGGVRYAETACRSYESNDNTSEEKLSNAHRLLERAEMLKALEEKGETVNNIGRFLILKWSDSWASVI